MNKQLLIRISKYLSYHLRHRPEALGLQLQPGGWLEVDKLLQACEKDGFPLKLEELQEVVAKNDKQRFSFDSTGTLIRANQGHSVTVDLQLEPRKPPSILYHGTGEGAVPSILKKGLLKMSRHHVHLSADVETAKKVGMRHGKPTVFQVDAAAMYRDGYQFFCSDNGVWLVDHVPSKYCKLFTFC